MKLQRLTSKLSTAPHRLASIAAGDNRLRGRAAVKRRASWLDRHPLCKHCEAEGRVAAAVTPDHIVPIWKGGVDSEANLQSLCGPCHDVKTKAEAAERAAMGR